MCSTTAASSPQKFCQTLEIRHICTDDFAIVNLLSSFGVSEESIDVFLGKKDFSLFCFACEFVFLQQTNIQWNR